MKLSKDGKYDASNVAAYIVEKINEDGGDLDHLKLQKLMYSPLIFLSRKTKTIPVPSPSAHGTPVCLCL